ncbi:ead/Ea22-like family protein [Escherichia coli]|uniref:ead/Ea22-like family protein n=1 Tax=Escherichia coli TaxID=562 RepID=UPI003A4E460B
MVANMQRLEMTARFFIQRLEQSGISEQRRRTVSKIDYQALREAAQNAKDLGGIKNYKRGEQAVAEFESLITPHIVLALLDERERNQQYIKRRDQENEDIALTVGKLRVELEAAKKRIVELKAEPVSQTYKLPPLSSNEVNDAAWKLHNMLTEHGPLNGRQFNNLKECFYEALKVAMRNYPVIPDSWISCSERMPDTKTAVLVAREFGRKGDWRMKWATYIPGHPDANDGWVIPGASWIPSHWMPLPEPPQEVNRG